MLETTNPIAEARAPRANTEAVALALFDGARVAHQLPAKARFLLQLAAACYWRTSQLGDERGDRVGRDLLLAMPLPQLSAEQQAIAACAVALQREKLRPKRESSFVWLGAKDQRSALALAAIIRLARALDIAPADMLVQAEDAGTSLIVGGAAAEATSAAAEAAAGPWREAIGPLSVRVVADDQLAQLRAGPAPGDPQFDERLDRVLALVPLPSADLGGEPIAEAARRALRRFFDKLLAREEAVLRDEDSEDVHQMRVATRRLRAALQTLEGVYAPDLIRRYRRGLRRIAQSLGAVRDGDVFLEHVVAYRDALPAPQHAALAPLIAAVSAERSQARAALEHDLASRRYHTFKREFAAFLSTPGAGNLASPEPGITQRMRDFAGSAIWRRYELWRAYEAALPAGDEAVLHQARIAGKRFRYTLEFFAEVLGPRVDIVLDPLIALQENLGTLQDIVTAHAHVAALGLAGDPGAQAYLATRTDERAPLLAALPTLWGKVDSGTYRRRLFELIVKI